MKGFHEAEGQVKPPLDSTQRKEAAIHHQSIFLLLYHDVYNTVQSSKREISSQYFTLKYYPLRPVIMVQNEVHSQDRNEKSSALV